MRCEGVLEPFLARSPPLRPHPRGHAPAAGVCPVHVPGVLMSAFQQARSARVSPLLRELSLRCSSGETFALGECDVGTRRGPGRPTVHLGVLVGEAPSDDSSSTPSQGE